MPRDSFSKTVIQRVGERAGWQCSNPDCGMYTLGAAENDTDVLKIGIAAHITAASKKGPRFNPHLTKEKRSSIQNAIHLCSNCARLIDVNSGVDYPPDLLYSWKKQQDSLSRDRVKYPNKYRAKSLPDFLSKAAENAVRKIQKFEDSFICERNQSSSGPFQQVIERQKIMGNLLDSSLRELRQELALLPKEASLAEELEKEAKKIIGLYRLENQTLDDKPFWGEKTAEKAALASPVTIEKFKQVCECFREKLKPYLN